MAGHEIDLNGKVSLAPLSVTRVNKFYTSQNEFLREPAVLATRSKKGEALYLISVAFDAQKQDDVSRLVDTVALFKAFPYVFIAGDVMENAEATLGEWTVGDGYFMYALHEYEIEVSSENQGLYLLSFRVQPINWKAITKKMAFLSLVESQGTGAGGSFNNIKIHTNPGESNVLDMMINYHRLHAPEIIRDLLISSKSEGQSVTIGVPMIANREEVKSIPHQVGSARAFRITPPSDTSRLGTKNDPDGQTGRKNASEISPDAEQINSAEERIYVAYRGVTIGPTDITAITSLVVRRRNRFANQTIADWTLPYAQYLGKSPSEVLIASQSNSDTVINSASPAKIMDSLNTFADQIRSVYPFLMGIDAFRLANPVINLMGVNHAILDSSQMSLDSQLNNLTINNYTFIESDQSSMLERSKYILASSSTTGTPSEKLDTILELARVVERNDANADPNVAKIKDDISRFHDYIRRQIASDNDRIEESFKQAKERASKDGRSFNMDISEYEKTLRSAKSTVPGGPRLLGTIISSPQYRNGSEYVRSMMVLRYMRSTLLATKDGQSDSETQKKNENARILILGVNKIYTRLLTSAPHNPLVQETLIREIKKEQAALKKNNDGVIFSGEAAPDLFLSDIFNNVQKIIGVDDFKYMSTLPFVYDVGHLDPKKIMALWNREKGRIDKEVEALSGYLVGVYGQKPKEDQVPIYDGQNKGKMSEFAVQMRASGDGSGATAQGGADNLLAGSANQGVASGSWMAFSHVVSSSMITGPFGKQRRSTKNPGGTRFHNGVDIGAPVGTSVRPMNAGVASQNLQGGGKAGWGAYYRVNHGGGFTTLYGHMSKFIAASGANVGTGTVIGLSGGRPGAWGAGSSTGPHMHLELIHNGRQLDATKFNASNKSTWITTGPLTGVVGQISVIPYRG